MIGLHICEDRDESERTARLLLTSNERNQFRNTWGKINDSELDFGDLSCGFPVFSTCAHVKSSLPVQEAHFVK